MHHFSFDDNPAETERINGESDVLIAMGYDLCELCLVGYDENGQQVFHVCPISIVRTKTQT